MRNFVHSKQRRRKPLLRRSPPKNCNPERPCLGLTRMINRHGATLVATIFAPVDQVKSSNIVTENSDKLPDPNTFLTSFSGRLAAISRNFAALSESHWQGLDFEQICRTELVPYAGPVLDRITLHGCQGWHRYCGGNPTS